MTGTEKYNKMGRSTRLDSFVKRDSSSSHVGSTPFSIGVLLAIVIGGSIAVCMGGAFFCIWLSRKRAAARQDLDYVDASEAFPHEDADSATTRTQSPRRLQKRPSHSPEKRKSNRASFLHSFSVPIISPMFTNDNKFGPLHGKGGESLTRLRSSSWIDEDALHGPKIKRHGTQGRKSIRDSWPLRSLLPGTPTVPKVQMNNHQDPYTRTGPLSTATASMPCLPVRQLPEPPKPAHLSQAEPRFAAGIPYVYEDFHQDDPQGANPANRTSPARSHTRNVSTDSTLSEILRSTEKRLQEGPGSGRRTRSTISPTRSFRTGQAESGDESASWHMRSRTPSPAKTVPNDPSSRGAHHRKQPSQLSVNSEADSIYDAYVDSSPERTDVPTALTSPSRTRRGEQDRAKRRQASTSSSVSSTLSTVYSEIEAHGDRSRIPAVPTNMPEEVGKIVMAQAAAQGDPFISSSPERSGKALQMTTPIRALPLISRPPRFQPSSAATAPSLPVEAESPTSPTSPAARQGAKSLETTPTHGRHGVFEHGASDKSRAPLSGRAHNVYPPPLRLNSTLHKFTSKNVAAHTEALDKPHVLVTSPTTPGLGLGRVQVHKVTEVVPPPHHLRPICSSPTLGRDMAPVEDDTLPPLPGSPELRLIGQRKMSNNPGSPSATGNRSPQLGRMRGSIRIVSVASSIYSQFPEDTNAVVKSPVEKSSDPNWARLPLPQENKDSLQVASTIGELRRMNSAVSSYSAASSYYSATSNQDPETVPLPVLRGGGCSPSRRGGGTRRYLALGSNNNSPKSTSKLGQADQDQGQDADEQKENAVDGMALQMPTIEVEMHSTPGHKRKRASGPLGSANAQFQTPRKSAKNRLSDMVNTATIMEDSPGLYDRDGFLICSPPKT